MRLISFSRDGAERAGVELDPERVLDLNNADPSLASQMIPFLAQGEEGMQSAAEAVQLAPAWATVLRSEIKLLAPVPRPGKLLCIGLNYADHAAESGAKVPDEPIVFAKYANAVIGAGEPIIYPKVTKELDYEAELAFVIGKLAKSVKAEEAYGYIAGYTCCHDVSARDCQRKDNQWVRAKSSDTFAPLGPALVTRDEIPDPHNLKIQCKVNGKIRQDSTTANLIFKIPQLLQHITAFMTLEPGDIVSTGTPAGVGFARKPPTLLNVGDEVEVYVEKIGSLLNPVVAEA